MSFRAQGAPEGGIPLLRRGAGPFSAAPTSGDSSSQTRQNDRLTVLFSGNGKGSNLG